MKIIRELDIGLPIFALSCLTETHIPAYKMPPGYQLEVSSITARKGREVPVFSALTRDYHVVRLYFGRPSDEDVLRDIAESVTNR